MKLTNQITHYNEKWPEQFENEVKRIIHVFGQHILTIHHVGSTAVKDLASKPEIDMLAVVSNTDKLDEWTDKLENFGYQRGKDLFPEHHFFKRGSDGERTHKLHICLNSHLSIDRMIKIRDHFRVHLEDKTKYEELKLRLEQENKTGITEYLERKKPFLDNLFDKISNT